MSERDEIIRAALRGSKGKTAAARANAKAKKEANAPHRALRDLWYELMALHHPNEKAGVKWAAPEYVLARSAISETDLETVSRDVRYFIAEWCPRNNKFPGFKLYWAVRGQVHAEAKGAVKPKKSREDRLKRGEYDEESAKKSPKIGWG